MKARAQHWGNSLAVRIPKSIAEQAGIRDNDELDIAVIDSVIRIRRRQKSPSLAQLVDRITAGNVHEEYD